MARKQAFRRSRSRPSRASRSAICGTRRHPFRTRWARTTRSAWPARSSAGSPCNPAGAGRSTLSRWSARPSCELYHRGAVLTGRLGVRTDAGEELVIGPDHVFDISARPPHLGRRRRGAGHARLGRRCRFRRVARSRWPPGRSGPCSSPTSSIPPDESQRRGDVKLGSAPSTMHDDVVRSVLTAFGGEEMGTAGDSFLVLLDERGAGDPVRPRAGRRPLQRSTSPSARASTRARSSWPTEQVQGVAVHVAARIVAEAASG